MMNPIINDILPALKRSTLPLLSSVCLLLMSLWPAISGAATIPATISWYDYGYASGQLTMPPTGNGRILDWHRRWPGHSDMYLVPGACSPGVSGLSIRCSSTSCGGGFTCRQKHTCPTGYEYADLAGVPSCVSDDSPKESGPPSCPNGAPRACSKNPINFATGNKFKIQTDYSSSVRYGLRFTRTYNSLSSSDNDSVMGSHWHHNHDIKLAIESSANGNIIKASRANSRVYTFTETANNSGIYTVDGDVNLTLTATASGYQLTDSRDNVEVYNSNGQLLSTTNKAGLTRTYIYDLAQAYGGDSDDATLDQITDPYGRTLLLTYNSNNQIDTMIDPAGNVTAYAYNGDNNLTTVTRPDNTTRTYHYESNSFKHALTGITDENNNRIETYTYHVDGKAASSEITGGIERVAVTYQSNGNAEVTDTAGQTRTYAFDTTLDVRRATGISGGACIGCGSVKDATYDANGNVEQSTDFNGNITTFTYNSRNLEETRTEAFGTPQARTITTQWHNQFRLPIQVDRPGQRTTYIYDTQGRLLSRTLTDMQVGSANNGQSRTTTYSYNTAGLLQSIDGTRTDVQDITAYAYDTQGNRISTTNALGHINQAAAFNEHGQPTTLIDINGITTTLQYDARKRLIIRAIAPGTDDEAITRYQYDGVGNLTQITLPDNSALIYEYDLANRLKAVQDNLGNRIEYTLDVQGNRTDEQTRDPLGQLTRQIQRSYDELNRLQQVVGAGG